MSLLFVLFSAVLCLQQTGSQSMKYEFGLSTCTKGVSSYSGTDNTAYLTLFWNTVMFKCTVKPRTYSSYYGCDSLSATTSRCDPTSPYPSDYGNYTFQISNVDSDDVCVTELRVVITDTQTNDATIITIDPGSEHQWVGNDVRGVGYRSVWTNIDPNSLAVQSISGTHVTYTPKCNSLDPTISPTEQTVAPTISTVNPTTFEPTAATLEPTVNPSQPPTTVAPSANPSANPSKPPTPSPSKKPTISPTFAPTVSPTKGTSQPTVSPTEQPTQFGLGDIKFVFGFSASSASDDEHEITLYWELGMYQCTVIPSKTNTKYLCDADGSNDGLYRRCHPDVAGRNFQMSIRTLGYTYDVADLKYLYIQVIDAATDDILTDMKLDPDYVTNGYPVKNYEIYPDTMQYVYEEDITGSGSYDSPDCDPIVSIHVTACDDFDYGSTSNSLQMQLKGTLGASPWFFVNKLSPLPTVGQIMDFEVWDVIPEDIGELYSVLISVDDSYGYCLAGISIIISGSPYVFGSDDYFGHGIILGSSCDYTFKFVSHDFPLLSCVDNYLELNTYSTRGIYEVDIHTCISDESGLAAPNMVDSFYLSIMGKKASSSEWISSDPILLDHYVAGHVDFSSLGHLIASNAIIESDKTDAIAIYPVDLEGVFVGIKIESVNYEDDIISSSSIVNVTVEDTQLDLWESSVFEDGRYLVAFFKLESRLNVTTRSQIYFHGYDGNHAVNIYIILDEYNDFYKLPFYLEKRGEYNGNRGIDWFSANDECKDKYGTLLTSIHSEEEQFLIDGFIADTGLMYAWIGLFDLNIGGGTSGWRWIDGSTLDFDNWDIPSDAEVLLDARVQPWNEDGYDCTETRTDAGTGDDGWFTEDCDHPDDGFICSSPYFNKDSNRKFEINIAENVGETIVVSVGNNNAEDSMCIDAISVNGQSARHISNNWIGGDSGAMSLQAIFRYPVCDTEVIGISIDYDSSTTNMINGDSTITGLECSNNNRLISTTCAISQGYEMSKTTSFSISNETSKASEYSWGSSETDETNIGFSVDVSVGYQVGPEIARTNVGLTAGFHHDWIRSEEENEQNTEGTENTIGSEASWETSETQSIQCSAESEVPPSHSMKYSLIFNAFNTTIRTYTDLKLTLCSAYTQPDADGSDESHYIYIDNIPGFIAHKEVTACEVQFSAAEYLRNDLSCAEEQQLSISMIADYFPRCREDGTYDGCQCTKDHSVCWCADDAGNVIDGKSMEIADGLLWQDACVNKLECQNSDVTNDNLLAALEDRMECATAQKFSVYNSDHYLPRCREHDSALYDGCQCDLGDKKTLASCWCVTEDGGDFINGKAMQVLDGMTFEQVCVSELQCENSDIVYQDVFTCAEAQTVAIANRNDYLPRCRDDGTYDGCQCNTGDHSMCWCVTADGSHIDGKATQVDDGITYQETCVQELECANSDVEHAAPAPVSSPFMFDSLIATAFVLVIVILWFLYKRYGANHMAVKYQKVSQIDTDFDSESPLKLED
eukprot:55788_1